MHASQALVKAMFRSRNLECFINPPARGFQTPHWTVMFHKGVRSVNEIPQTLRNIPSFARIFST
jgi:hypothetical protein